MMTFRLSALLLLAVTACSPAKSPDMIRANARAAVAVAKSTYVLVGNACLDAAQLTGNTKIAVACADALDPAYNLIVDAAAAVDAGWTPAAACSLVKAVDDLSGGVRALGAAAPASLGTAVHDGQLLAAALLGPTACALPTDAGAR